MARKPNNKQLTAVERFDRIDNKLDAIDAKLDAHLERIVKNEAQIQSMQGYMKFGASAILAAISALITYILGGK